MTHRLDYLHVAPGAVRAMMAVESFARSGDLDPTLLHLVKVRASYLNGCAYCVDMHTQDARLLGETEQRLYAVPVWRETPFYSPRERAALAWAETLTLIAGGGVPDAAYEAARSEFSDAELVQLTMAVVAINGWNRLAVTFGITPGSYVPPGRSDHATAPAR